MTDKSLGPLTIWVREKTGEKRWRHTCGAVATSARLAQRFGYDVDRAKLAALLHDCARNLPLERMQRYALEAGLDVDPEVFSSPMLLHAQVGAEMAKRDAHIDDEQVLEAVRCHTTGKRDMNKLDKILYLADLIEPGRSYPGLDEIREIAQRDLDEAVLLSLGRSIEYLIEKREKIYPRTLEAYNGLIEQLSAAHQERSLIDESGK